MSKDKSKRNLYFYIWDRAYMSAAQSSFRITCSVKDFEYDDNLEDFSRLRSMGVEVYASLPVLWKEGDAVSPKEIGDLVDGLYIGNAGQIRWGLQANKPMMADAGLNIYNAKALKFYLERGFKGAVISYELDPVDKAFTDAVNQNEDCAKSEIEILRYGRVPAMVSEYCPLAGANGVKGKACGKCMEQNPVYLKDNRGERYPVILDDTDCTSLMLSKEPLNRKNGAKALNVISNAVHRVTVFDESPSFIARL